MRTGTGLNWWIPVVWREGARSRGWDGGHSRYHRRGPGVQIHWDQLPDPTRVGVAVVQELYLGYGHFNRALQRLRWDADLPVYDLCQTRYL